MDYQKKPHYTGKIAKNSGLIYTTRNVFFEPASRPYKDWVTETLQGVEKALKKQPAIIGSYRINYIVSLGERNRAKSLRMLKIILQTRVSKYPSIEFAGSAELAGLITLKN
jgi:hypothetical protein